VELEATEEREEGDVLRKRILNNLPAHPLGAILVAVLPKLPHKSKTIRRSRMANPRRKQQV